MVIKKFPQFEFPVLFSEKPEDESHPFKGSNYMAINDPKFNQLEESDGYKSVSLVSNDNEICYYPYCAGKGEGFECNELSNRAALLAIDSIELEWSQCADCTGYYPHVRIDINNPTLNEGEASNLEIKFSSKNNLKDLIDACILFARTKDSILARLIKENK